MACSKLSLRFCEIMIFCFCIAHVHDNSIAKIGFLEDNVPFRLLFLVDYLILQVVR